MQRGLSSSLSTFTDRMKDNLIGQFCICTAVSREHGSCQQKVAIDFLTEMPRDVGTHLFKACCLVLMLSLLAKMPFQVCFIIIPAQLCKNSDTYVPCWDVLKVLACPQMFPSDLS